MNQKELYYIIVTSAAEYIDLDATVASVVVKEAHLNRKE